MATAKIKIDMNEVHKAIREYVERKYGVKAVSDAIHYSSYGEVEFKGATVEYHLVPKQ